MVGSEVLDSVKSSSDSIVINKVSRCALAQNISLFYLSCVFVGQLVFTELEVQLVLPPCCVLELSSPASVVDWDWSFPCAI